MINYFDIGLHKDALEIDMFFKSIKGLDIDYRVYGFEAHPEYAKRISEKHKNNDKVHIYNLAIWETNGILPLYLANKTGLGNSLFKGKNNVDKKQTIDVQCVVFSEWLKSNADLDNINILRFNIEGAELYLIKDLISSGIYKNIDLYLGDNVGKDIRKCKEIASCCNDYKLMLKEHGINIIKFIDWPRSRRAGRIKKLREDIEALIQNR